jgi:molybdopterin-guanine dinucleotide biosynthesis protein A
MPTNPTLPPLLGGLLVGGASRRMGRPKALIAVGGTTLAERAVAALAPHVERVVLLGGGPVPPALGGLERLADATLSAAATGVGERSAGGAGPLAALLAALRAEPAAAWVLCPCDLPAVRPEAVAWLVAQRRPQRRAVMARLAAGGPPEPLLALYEPTIRAAVEALAAAGGRAPRLLAGLPGVALVAPPAELAGCWRDVDRPEDLVAAR